MNKLLNIIVFTFLVTIVFIACRKEEVPTVNTAEITEVGSSTAVCGGEVLSEGSESVTARGVCWSTEPEPTLEDDFSNDGFGPGVFISTITNLNLSTEYYFRAYATNSVGTAYGEEKSLKLEIPVVTTAEISDISSTAVCGGEVHSEGSAKVTARGICWSTESGPTIEDNLTSDGAGTGVFISTITNLNFSTVYYVRAYATSSTGTAYGEEKSFKPEIPVVTTAGISNISSTAVCGGEVLSEGSEPVIARGVCWSTKPGPTIKDNFTSDGAGPGAFVSTITNLNLSTDYYVRAYATSYTGTAYGEEKSLKPEVPVVATAAISGIRGLNAISGGEVLSEGSGSVTARGVCWSTAHGPTVLDNITSDGTGKGVYTSTLKNLELSKQYYLRAYATNSAGTGYGDEIGIRLELPSVTTAEITAIEASTAVSGGVVVSEGTVSVTARGICWDIEPGPTINDSCTIETGGTGVFGGRFIKLMAGTKYYARAYATNSIGTAYGEERTFETPLIDGTGYVYSSVKIGSQTWIVENLRTMKLNDGISLAWIIDKNEWVSTTVPAYDWHEYIDYYLGTTPYGALYNWYAVKTGKLCPVGWHVPTNQDWITLENSLGGQFYAQRALKETGTAHWYPPNTDATNSSGFTGLPGAYKNGTDPTTGYTKGMKGFWWSATELNAGAAYYYLLTFDNFSSGLGMIDKHFGFSVRCVRDR